MKKKFFLVRNRVKSELNGGVIKCLYFFIYVISNNRVNKNQYATETKFDLKTYQVSISGRNVTDSENII